MQQEDERGAHAVGRDAREEQTERRYGSLMGGRNDDQHEDERRARDGARPHAGNTGGHVQPKENGGDSAEGRARRDAQRIGGCEAVPQHRLKDAPPERERRTRKQTEERARQAKLNENRPVGRLPIPDARQIERRRAQERKHRGREQKQSRRAADPRARPSLLGRIHW